MIANLLEQLSSAKLYDLSQAYYPGMPHYPTHPPFLYSLTKQHCDFVNPGGGSSAADAIAMGTHVGTHIDALCHFSCDGKLHGGTPAEGRQSWERGIEEHSIETVAPIVRRGILLDIAGYRGVDVLPVDFTITPECLHEAAVWQGVDTRAGDVVLLRTGWARYYAEAARYIAGVCGPGPELAGARWLSSHTPFAVGSDTVAFERVPSPSMEVHVHLLFEMGIHIIEVLNLEELAHDRVYEFLFAGAPLKIRGGTGAPIRPFALAL